MIHTPEISKVAENPRFYLFEKEYHFRFFFERIVDDVFFQSVENLAQDMRGIERFFQN